MQSNLAGNRIWALVALASQLTIGMPLVARAQDQATPPSSSAPDNSSQNKKHARTAESQKENA